jgi:hypothetical protein
MTIKDATQQVRSKLSDWLKDPKSRTTEDVAWVRELLQKQDHWRHKTSKVSAVRSVKRRGCMYLQVKVDPCNRWCTVSWLASFGRVTTRPLPILSAMRNSVKRQVSLWKSAHLAAKACTRCHATTFLQADHVTPFIQIAKEFIAKTPTNEPKAFDCRACKGFYFKKADVAYARAFRAHHKTHATFQWLCKSCNCSKGVKVTEQVEASEDANDEASEDASEDQTPKSPNPDCSF